MTRFIHIDPEHRVVTLFSAATFEEAVRTVGLDPRRTDYGVIARTEAGGIGVVVYEFGLRKVDQRTGAAVPPQRYFDLGGNLYAGQALVYQFDERGETVDAIETTRLLIEATIRWWREPEEIERAIERGQVTRPDMTLTRSGGVEVLWRWEP